MKYRQLTLEKRYTLYRLFKEGYRQNQIANVLGVHPSTVGREMKRNKRRRGYRPQMAHGLAMRRRKLVPLGRVVKTLTSDNGFEFAGHVNIARKLKADFYFARPYSPWERGLNEQINGLIRQYYPKGTDFESLTQTDVYEVMKQLNHRPRKTLNYKTPAEILFPAIALGV